MCRIIDYNTIVCRVIRRDIYIHAEFSCPVQMLVITSRPEIGGCCAPAATYATYKMVKYTAELLHVNLLENLKLAAGKPARAQGGGARAGGGKVKILKSQFSNPCIQLI